MKRIIDGLTYDTDTAVLLVKWENGAHEETLYQTEDGRYFLHGWSGALGPYSVPIGNNGRGEGSAIVPMTREEAFKWLVTHITETSEL